MIDKFEGDYRFLSNFWECPILWNGVTYKSAEHFYQARKAITPEDHEKIRNASVSECKRIGNRIDIRDDWDSIKIRVMDDVVFLKFTQNKDLQIKLMKTFPSRLVEGNTWHDNFWGNCTCKKCSKQFGKNYLGQTLEHWRQMFIVDMIEKLGS